MMALIILILYYTSLMDEHCYREAFDSDNYDLGVTRDIFHVNLIQAIIFVSTRLLRRGSRSSVTC
jgi:hypothetical protein